MPADLETVLAACGYQVTVKRGGWIVIDGAGHVRRFHGRRALAAWVPPGAPWTAGFDGAAEPTNPGPAAYGAWIRAPWGDCVWQASVVIGWGTNNVAEWQGLIAVLTTVRQLGIAPVVIQGDSQLVVRQFTGEYAVRAPQLQSLWATARQLAAGQAVTVRWVPRAANAAADQLSKAALRALLPLRFDPARLEPQGPQRWIAHGTRDYWVDTRARTCTCPAFRPGRPYKHLTAALMAGE